MKNELSKGVVVSYMFQPEPDKTIVADCTVKEIKVDPSNNHWVCLEFKTGSTIWRKSDELSTQLFTPENWKTVASITI